MENNEVTRYVPDQLFPSDNGWEIPTLDLDMQATECQIPFVCYGEQKRTFQMNWQGTLHFYTDDYRYGDIYQHPEKIFKGYPAQIVEPNYSTFNEMPFAFGMQAIYKKRFIARIAQQRGVRVFVDLNTAHKFYKFNMLGVPLGWSAFCTRGYSDRLANLEFEYDLAQYWAKDHKPLFVIYGGGLDCRHFAAQHNCIYITPVVTNKKRVEALKEIAKNSLFSDELFKGVDKLTKFDGQMADFSKKLESVNSEKKALEYKP